jgi:hypothetical protein
MAGNVTWLRHGLATLAYRFAKSVRGADSSYGDFDPGAGARPPREIVRHLTQLVRGMVVRFRGGSAEDPPPLDWNGEVARFHLELERLDQLVEAGPAPPDDVCLAVLQGPLSDALTHVGQIAMLRRLAGSPVPGENFSRAGVRQGHVGADQPLPAEPFRE